MAKFAHSIGGQLFAVGDEAIAITTSGTFQLTTQTGKIAHVIIWNAGTTWTLDVYDANGSNVNQVWGWATADGKNTYALQIPVDNGVRVVTTGATPGKATVVYA
jgi:hypothetical protein